MNKEDLLSAIKEGEEAAFKTLFLNYYEALSQFACRYVRSMAIAEGLVQDVFANLWEMRAELDHRGNIRSYLYTAVKNQAFDYLKHQQVVRRYEQVIEIEIYENKYDNPTPQFTNDRFLKAVQRAIEDLPEHTRNIYKMSRKNGFTYREIAQIHDVSIKTVESHISKALRILRKRLYRYRFM